MLIDNPDRNALAHLRPLPCALFVLVLFLLLNLAVDQARSKTYLLHPDGIGDFAALQPAIIAASHGDTLELAPGTYSGLGNLNLSLQGKSITIISADRIAETCVIDCQQQGRALIISGPATETTIIEGITITGGEMENGGGVRCSSSSPTFIRCHLLNNSAAFNGGALVASDNTQLRFIQCRFSTNQVNTGGGGGLWITDSSVLFDECEFQDNTIDRGTGGAIWFGNSAAVFEDCIFTGNTVYTGSGGAVACANSEASFSRCRFSHNVCTITGGALAITSSNPLLTKCTLTYNFAERGSALSCKNAKPIVTNCTFADNAAPKGSTINSELFSDILLIRSIIAFGSGSACACADANSQIALSSCCLFANQGGDWTGCIGHLNELPGNQTANPLFCDPEGGVWSLRPSSPCLPENRHPPGGKLIGAWAIGCETGR